MEEVWKNLQKVIQKGGKNEEKTFKKAMWKKSRKNMVLTDALPANPGRPLSPTNTTKSTRYIQTFHTNPTMSEEGEWRRVCEERWLQTSNTPRAPSGPERIYLKSVFSGLRGKPVEGPRLHYPLRARTPRYAILGAICCSKYHFIRPKGPCGTLFQL